ncbi:MAG: SAM hydrolase/SAM-dependent halogenase family protein [Pyrinomonadaceae bacterium]
MIIALLTDFGTKDFFVGAMKGVILSISEKAKIVDITHEIEPQNIRSANFTLRACYKNFPAKTIFVAVVDPGVGSKRRAILVETGDYFFIAPDNGLLSFIFNESDDFSVYEIANEKFFNQPVSRTFHGRDVFAPCAAHLSNKVLPREFGNKINDFVRCHESKPRKISDKILEAEIIYADRFGNLITNLTGNDLPKKFYLEFNNQKISKIQKYFSESEPDEIFMFFGSAGFLEIAAFKNSAKKILNAEINGKIKAIFEK